MRDTDEAVTRGTQRALLELADAGFEVSQREVPHGATSHLSQSGFPPRVAEDGAVEWGYTADYAEPVEKGAAPHWIPKRAMPELRKWARRVLGDEQAAWAVRAKIAQEGTDPQPFVRPGVDAMKAKASQMEIGEFIDAEIGGSHQ